MTSLHPHRMRDLVRLTGASAPTVHFYAQQGLLPAPQKTAGNQARYSAETVERIRWIRALQADLRLPLRTIRWVLERWGELPMDEIQALLTLGSLLDEPDAEAAPGDIDSLVTQLEPGDLEALRAAELIPPAGVRLESADARLIELVGAMRNAGFTEAGGFSGAHLTMYRETVERLVDEELTRFVEPALALHDPETMRDLVRRGMPLVHQLLALLHQRAMRTQIRRWLDMSDVTSDEASA